MRMAHHLNSRAAATPINAAAVAQHPTALTAICRYAPPLPHPGTCLRQRQQSHEAKDIVDEYSISLRGCDEDQINHICDRPKDGPNHARVFVIAAGLAANVHFQPLQQLPDGDVRAAPCHPEHAVAANVKAGEELVTPCSHGNAVPCAIGMCAFIGWLDTSGGVGGSGSHRFGDPAIRIDRLLCHGLRPV